MLSALREKAAVARPNSFSVTTKKDTIGGEGEVRGGEGEVRAR